jgi:hypothetical protein
VITLCGCVVIPEPLMALTGSRKYAALCDAHGWQDIIRRITTREALNEAMGLPLGTMPDKLPDDPVF